MRSDRRGWRLSAAWLVITFCVALLSAQAAAAGAGCDDFDLNRAGMAYLTACALAGADEHVPSGPAEPSFSDVPADFWAYRYVEYCRRRGVVAGYGGGVFHPLATATRDQMAVVTSRAIAGGDTEVPTGPATPTFADVPSDYWAYRYIEYLNTHVADAAYSTAPLTFAPTLPMSAFAAVSWLQQGLGVAPDPCLIPLLSRTETECVSTAFDGGPADGDSNDASLSADGRYVAFASAATDLVPDDTNGHRDVFVYDRDTNEMSLASVSSGGVQGDQDSSWPAVSADGRYVAFASSAANLVEGLAVSGSNIYVHDRAEDTTECVSVAGDGAAAGGYSSSPSISADGRYVAFQSDAADLVANDTNGVSDIFVYDRATHQTQRVSVAADGKQADGHSTNPAISANGRVVAFWSAADNLVPGDSNGVGDIFVRDLTARTTERVSVANDGAQASVSAEQLRGTVLSADGRFVLFASAASGLVPGHTGTGAPDLYLRDRSAHTTELIGLDLRAMTSPDVDLPGAAISGDGRFVVFCTRWHDFIIPALAGDFAWIYLYDRARGSTTLVSVNAAGLGLSRGPALSANGRAAAYSTHDQTWNVYVRAPGQLGYGALGGSILDAVTGAPVPGAAVWLDGSLWADGSSGRYLFPAAPSGPAHAVTADVSGYQPVSITGVRVQEWQTTTVDIALTPTGSAPTADFTANPLSGVVPLTVTFTDASTGGPTDWSWDFGDGDTSAEQNPVHTYRKPRHYTVSLTALNGERSSTKMRVRYITAAFIDVPDGFWAQAAIWACVDAGLVTGYPGGSYVPGEQVTRDQMAVYVSRALAGGDARVPSGPAAPTFPDVPTGHWAYRYVQYAWARDVAEGFPDGTYRPSRAVDRGEMAVYVARAIANPVGDTAVQSWPPPTIPSFPDVPTSFWAFKYIEYIKAVGIVGGYPDGKYHPDVVVTRDQMAVYVWRAF